MIRYSNSFFISLLIHSMLFLIIAGAYYLTNHTKVVVSKQNAKLCVSLCSYVERPKIVRNIQKEKKTKIVKTKIVKIKNIERKVVKIKKVIKPLIIAKKSIPKKEKELVTIDKVYKEVIQKSLKSIDIQKRVETIVVHEKTMQEKYIEENIQKIISLLQENLYYPRRARKKGIVGEVKVRFVLSTQAEVLSVTVLTSPSDILSKSAIKTIEGLSYRFVKPKQRMTVVLPIMYRLK